MKRNKPLVLLGSICLVLIMASLPFMAACAKPAPAKPIELAYTLHTPPPPPEGGTADQASVEYWAQEVGKRTDGRVTIKFYYGAVLGKPTDFIKIVGGEGVADIGNIIGTYNVWGVPLFAGALQPFLTTGVDVEGRALTKLYNEWAPMREEWVKHNLKPLWWYVVDPYWLLCKKPITKLDDLKGSKVWGAGGFAEIIKKFGITQVFFPAPEAYDALQKGTLDGIVFPYGPAKIFRYEEICKVFVDLGFAGGQTPNAQAINLDVWNKISPADQKTIEEISAGMHGKFLEFYDSERQKLRDYYDGLGITHITLSPEEQTRIRDMCSEALWTDWIAKCKEKGVPGEEFLTRYKAIVAELTK